MNQMYHSIYYYFRSVVESSYTKHKVMVRLFLYHHRFCIVKYNLQN